MRSDARLADITASLSIPFGHCRVHPAVEDVREPTIDWLVARGLLGTDEAIERYDTMHFERLAAMAYPDCPRVGLGLAARLMGWFFVFDDQFDGPLGRDPQATAAVVTVVVDALGAAPAARAVARRFAVAFRELWLESCAGMSAAWRTRARAAWIRYLNSYITEARARGTDAADDLAAYLRTREDSIGIPPSVLLAESLHHAEVSARITGRPPLPRLMALTGVQVALVNDLFSVHKELAAGETYNSVLMFQRALGCPLDRAAQHVAALIASVHAEFARQRETLAASLGWWRADVSECAAVEVRTSCMIDWMHANLAWSLETARYRGSSAAGSGGPQPWSGQIPVPGTRRT